MIASFPLEKVWPQVGLIILKTLQRQGKPAVIAQKIYEMCRTKRCLIFSCTEDASFAVVEQRVDPDTGDTILFIWAAYGTNGQRERNLGYLREIARACGAKRFVTASRRKGFGRVGWKVQDIVYSMEV